jgi:FkbM family methyltransferase
MKNPMLITQRLIADGFLEGIFLRYADIGARLAAVSSLRTLGKHLKYYGFEPEPEEFARLEESSKAAANPWETRFFPIAIDKDAGSKPLYLTKDPLCASLFEPQPETYRQFQLTDKMEVERVVEVETQSLDAWASTNGIGGLDYVKIDVQGAALNVLDGGKDCLASALCIECETEFIPFYKDQPLFLDLLTYMDGRGYYLVNLYKVTGRHTGLHYKTPTRGQLVWGDAIFFRKRELLFGNDDPEKNRESLFRMMVIAEYYGMPDYAVSLLDLAAERYADRFDSGLELKKLSASLKALFEKTYAKSEGELSPLMKRFYHSPIGKKLFTRAYRMVQNQEKASLPFYRNFFWKEKRK